MFRLIALSLVTFFFLGCGNQVTFPVSIPIPEHKVEGDPLLDAVNGLIAGFLPPISVDISESREFERHDVDRIESIRLTELTLALTENSDAENFNFLDRVAIEATDESGERSVQVALLDPVPSDVRNLRFQVTDEELNDIFGTDFTLNFKARGRPPRTDAKFDGEATFSVQARVL